MPSNKPGSRLIKAAGAVAWRPGPGGEPEILLVHRKKYDDWSLPKGKVEAGEPLPVTATREVLEEGGARVELGRRLVSVRYKVGGRPKRVHYWAAQVLSVDDRAVPNAEVDEVTWVPADRAVGKVSYPHDHGVLADFTARPARTVPLILVRHAKAVGKSDWKRADEARPLDGSGRSDAKALADLVACFAARPRLLSSPASRCMETLAPLAELTGQPVRAERALSIHGKQSQAGPDDPVFALVRAAIAAGEPTVICAHRENLPRLQEAALAALAARPGDVPGDMLAQLPKDWRETLPTGAFWVLNIAAAPPGGQAGQGDEAGGARQCPVPPESDTAPAPAVTDPAGPDPAVADPAGPDAVGSAAATPDPAGPDSPDREAALRHPAEPHQAAGAPPRPAPAAAEVRRGWWRRLIGAVSRRTAPAGPDPAGSGPAGTAPAGRAAGPVPAGPSAASQVAGGHPADDGPGRVPEPGPPAGVPVTGEEPETAEQGEVVRPALVLVSVDRYDPAEH